MLDIDVQTLENLTDATKLPCGDARACDISLRLCASSQNLERFVQLNQALKCSSRFQTVFFIPVLQLCACTKHIFFYFHTETALYSIEFLQRRSYHYLRILVGSFKPHLTLAQIRGYVWKSYMQGRFTYLIGSIFYSLQSIVYKRLLLFIMIITLRCVDGYCM